MTEDHKKPGWTFWTVVLLIALPVAYVASFGPACWLTARCGLNDNKGPPSFMRPYAPLGQFIADERAVTGDVLHWWAGCGVLEGVEVCVPTVQGTHPYKYAYWTP